MAWPNSAGSWSVFLASVATFISLAAGDGTCEISGGYDYKRLFTTAWHVDVKGSAPCVTMGAQSCFWTLSFCGDGKEQQCGKDKACEWLNTTAAKPMGQFTTLQANGQNSFVVKFQEAGGSLLKCSDPSKTLRTNVIFTCDHDKPIPIGPGSLVTKLPYNNIDERDPCERNVTVPYDGACGSAPATSSGGLSTGSILLILFFVGLLIYIVGGILVNRNNGAQGVEMIPHLQFWKELPSLIVEGCVFFVQLITCQSGRSDRTYDNI
ncbi:uncharacterized protein LOC119446009 [Dermacentor silvarum]|uniref:uncharacterized protein LOC119446009 n=1 Tax=Dermacentor silvarum TaxID=543639 RepID=UPI00189AE6D8|nr:uncharacterized protein LOC119446009 [Dermacentor silvarum]